MHQNRQMALQGMTKQEQIEAEKCVQHMRDEFYRPHISRNTYTSTMKPQLLTKNEIAFSHFVLNDLEFSLEGAENEKQDELFEDVHQYETYEC